MLHQGTNKHTDWLTLKGVNRIIYCSIYIHVVYSTVPISPHHRAAPNLTGVFILWRRCDRVQYMVQFSVV